MESPDNTSPSHLRPFSVCAVALLSGMTAGLATLPLLLGGVFHGADQSVETWLGFVSALHRFPIGIEAVLVLLGGVGAAWIALDVPGVSERRFLLGMTALQPVSAMTVTAVGGTYFSPFAVLSAIGLGIAAATIFRRSAMGLRIRRVEAAFSRHVSPKTLQQLTKNGRIYQSYAANVTALVCRFEGQQAEEIPKGAAFFKNQGAWVEEQAGNRLLALFNTPLPQEGHTLKASSSALEFMQDHPQWRIGMAVGTVAAGVPEKTLEFRVSGPPIDEAEAVCRANSRLGTSLLASLETFEAVSRDVVARPVDLLELPETNAKTELYELLALTKSASPELLIRRDRFWEGVILSRRGENREAAARFRDLGDDPIARFFLKRLEAGKDKPEPTRAAN